MRANAAEQAGVHDPVERALVGSAIDEGGSGRCSASRCRGEVTSSMSSYSPWHVEVQAVVEQVDAGRAEMRRFASPFWLIMP
jgi:hypothetical protein